MLTLKDKPVIREPQGSSHPHAADWLGDRWFWLALASILFLAATLYVSLSLNWPKFSRAEVFFAECAREMLAKSNFVTPLYHGQPFFDKPILAYWLILGNFKLFGVSHLVARIPSIASALVTVALAAMSGAALGGRRAGLLAAMALSSAFMFFSFACLCMSDMLLVMFDTATMILLYTGAANAHRRTLLWWLASVCMGLAFLTKGPVGVVLPALAFLLYMGMTRQLGLISLKHIGLGALTTLIISLPWFLAAWKANGSGSMYWFFVRENFQRFAGSTYDSHRPVWYILVSLLTGFAPWSLFLPVILGDSLRKWKADFQNKESRRDLYLWLWVATITIFFSLSRGKIDYYALPAYPACAILVGMYLARWIDRADRPALTAGGLLSACLIIGGLASICLLSPLTGAPSPAQWLLMPAALSIAGVLMFRALWQKRLYLAYALAYAGLVLGMTGFCLQVLPAINKLQPCLQYAAVVRASDKGTRVGMDKTLASWVDEVTFQTGREPETLDGPDALKAFLSGPDVVLAMVPKSRFDELPLDMLATVRVLDSRPYIAHALNPGYAIKRKGELADDVPLLLLTNDPQVPQEESNSRSPSGQSAL